MARATQTAKTTRPAAPLGKPSGPGRKATATAKLAAGVNKATGSNRTPTVAKPRKDELRAWVEKLKTANARLRAKNHEANRAAKTAAVRIAELEDQLAQRKTAGRVA
jgi:hypothetical protein